VIRYQIAQTRHMDTVSQAKILTTSRVNVFAHPPRPPEMDRLSNDVMSVQKSQRQAGPSASILTQRLIGDAASTQFVQIYGEGPLWEKLIGHGPEQERILGDGWRVGIELRGKLLIRRLLRTLRSATSSRTNDADYNGLVMTIYFRKMSPDGVYDYLDAVDCLCHGGRALLCESGTDPPAPALVLRRGGVPLVSFMRRMARRAQGHDHSISFFEVTGD
jgi:hypothetical protein